MPILKNLNTREKTLAFLLAGIGFLLLNLLVLPKLTAANRANKSNHTELQAELNAAQGWMSRKDFWAERKQWLEENEPALGAARQDNVTQLEELQQLAKNFDLKISDVQLLQLVEAPFYSPVGAKLSVVGPWSGLVQFLAQLQTPTRFNVVPRFSIKSAEELANIQCEMEIQRWFRKNAEVTP